MRVRKANNGVVDLEDAAKIIGIHPETLRRYHREGKVDCIERDVHHNPPYFFYVDYLKTLPKFPARGRPRKNQSESEVRL